MAEHNLLLLFSHVVVARHVRCLVAPGRVLEEGEHDQPYDGGHRHRLEVHGEVVASP